MLRSTSQLFADDVETCVSKLVWKNLDVICPEVSLCNCQDVKMQELTNFFQRTRKSTIVSQTNSGTVSKAALGKLLRDVMELFWAFLSA